VLELKAVHFPLVVHKPRRFIPRQRDGKMCTWASVRESELMCDISLPGGCLGSCTLDDSSTCTLDRGALSSIGTDGSVLIISRGKQWRARDQLWTMCYAGQGSTVADGGEPGWGSTIAKGSRGVASHWAHEIFFS
jgi:hypothetical protein